mmetsp:Transcript_19119/g.28592  ORF Transcript_19119/g.28592 Transcript_19119/m.28592 type:complete len:162 (-) Transcript_19119:220-705(-)
MSYPLTRLNYSTFVLLPNVKNALPGMKHFGTDDLSSKSESSSPPSSPSSSSSRFALNLSAKPFKPKMLISAPERNFSTGPIPQLPQLAVMYHRRTVMRFGVPPAHLAVLPLPHRRRRRRRSRSRSRSKTPSPNPQGRHIGRTHWIPKGSAHPSLKKSIIAF